MATKDRRREVRLASSDDELLTEAAGILGVTVSEFLLERALSDAADIVDAHRSVILSEEDLTKFLAALDAPVGPPEELVGQMRRARSLKRVD